MTADWIDLDRQFAPHQTETDREAAALRSYLHERDHGPLDWPRLQHHTRVVVLGEAGSGKTWEFRNQTERLRAAGQAAFFLHLEQLADAGIAGALNPQDRRLLEAWRRGAGPACFFLDAVEEARLSKPHQFEVALRHLAGELGGASDRVSIALSSRITGWRVEDARLVADTFGPGKDSAPDAAHPALEADVAVVELAPLTPAQVRRLAEEEITDVDAFMEAIKDRDAWDFTGRPYDVRGLLSYWKDCGTLGSLTEIVEHDIDRKLREDNPDRHYRTQLDRKRARTGAEALAAATVLSRRFTFTVSGTLPPEGTLAPEAVLEDWRPEDIQALLERPIFDEAAFERVRFHHRHVAEYLAARWLKRLLDAGAPRQAIADLLFRRGHGDTEVIPDALAPVAAWLAGTEGWVRRRLMAVNPDALLTHGDPAAIPLPEREALLKRLMAHHRFRLSWEQPAQLKRLADPALGPAVAELLGDPGLSEDQQVLLLRLAAIGRLAEAAPVAASIAANRSLSEDVRRLAVEAGLGWA